jgi:hypothetical protein
MIESILSIVDISLNYDIKCFRKMNSKGDE